MTTKKTTKKVSSNKKNLSKKSVAHKKSSAKVASKPVAVVEPKKVAQPISVEKKEETPKTKKMYEISPFFHGLIVLMVVMLYAELTAFAVIYYNFDVSFDYKDTVLTRQVRAREKAKLDEVYRLRSHRVRRSSDLSRRTRRPVAQKQKNVHTAVKANNEMKNKIEKPVFKCPEPVARKVSFVEAEYAPYAGEGNAVIEGSACFALNDGSEKCFAGVDVFINPVTSYSDEWYERGWAGREFLQKADERAIAFNKMVKTDANGKFKFNGLKPGSYYVGTAVCLPENKDTKACHMARFASKVAMKNRVQTTLKKVFP